MSTDSWERVETLFTAALERPSAQRSAFVTATTDDPNVSAEVLSLLHAHERRDSLDSLTDRPHGSRRADASSDTDLGTRLRAGLGRRYRVKRELGRGGMAIVWLAEDVKHGRKVALKILHPALARSIAATRFLQEIAIAAQLAHPHILPLHDSGETDGLLYYVMPYVEGESLRDRLQRERRLSLSDALTIARQVAGALSYAHARDIVHRDVKPDNILLLAGHAVITDFGIARAMTAAGGDETSETSIILGTPAYMSPEQVLGRNAVDARSDVYSLGCVLYEMLAGQPLFTGPNAESVLQEHLRDRPPSLTELPADVPDNVTAAIRRAVAKTPSHRFSTAAELAAALPLPGVREPRRRVPRVVAVGAVVCLAVTGVVAASVLNASRSPAHPATAVIAVLPLAVVEHDTALTRVGRDLVVTLSANLDDVREIRTVDPLTVLAQTRQSGALTLEQGTDLARLLGASSVVTGTIGKEGGKLRVEVGLFRTDDRRAIARASITTDALDLATLTDSVSRRLLRGAWRGRAAPSPSVASLTTQSLPALQAFLEGERAVIENRWQGAAEAYARAMSADSRFLLAYWRYAFASWWYLQAVDDSVINRIRSQRFALPDRDRLVFESWVTDSFSVGLTRAREAVERYPDFWPGWMQYADWLFHVAPVYGHDRMRAVAALERTVTLNPAFVSAWEHLYWATIQYDTTTARRALEALVRLDFGRSAIAEFGFDITRVYRLELQWARSGALDRALLDSIAGDLVSVARGRIGGGATLLPVQVEISRRVLAGRPRPQVAAIHQRVLADAWAGRGAFDSALAIAPARESGNASGALAAYRLAVIGAWLEAVSPASAARLRPVSVALPVDTSAQSSMLRAEVAWLDGLLAATARDRNALGAARAGVRESGAATSALLDRSLAAFETELSAAATEVEAGAGSAAASRAAAARVLADLNWERPDLLAPGYEIHQYVIAVSRLAAARWIISLGETGEAARLLTWFDAAWALDGYRPARQVLVSLAIRERARIAEIEGNIELARAAYEEFIRRYDMPAPAHRSLANEAMAALERMGYSTSNDIASQARNR